MTRAALSRFALLATLLAPLAAQADSHAAPNPEQILRGAAAQVSVDFDAILSADDPSPTLVSINFDYTMPDAAFEAEMTGSAGFLAEMPGLTGRSGPGTPRPTAPTAPISLPAVPRRSST